MHFQLEKPTQLVCSNANTRTELHGEDRVRAIDLAFTLTGENTLLDLPLLDDQHPYRNGYALLWESINGADSWAANPWTWAVSFRRIAP